MSRNVQYHSRSIYSILDFLGDVGGLLGILEPIGGIIVSLFSFCFMSKMENFIMLNTFKSNRDNDNNFDADVQPGIKNMFGICLRDKDKKRKERASARFEKELDVVNFMRKQLKLNAI